jgi:hypothetical protein
VPIPEEVVAREKWFLRYQGHRQWQWIFIFFPWNCGENRGAKVFVLSKHASEYLQLFGACRASTGISYVHSIVASSNILHFPL